MKISNRVSTIKRLLLGLLCFISFMYLIGIIWINFHGKLWYNMDMYTDAYVSKLMWEQKTLFPRNWIFGNQYYVIATPVLSALFYGFFKDSFIAMACASTTMTLIVVGLFAWCFKPAANKSGILIGLFCIIGGVILGNSASETVNGMQCLYTMCSYYACYMIGILLTLGIYLRLLLGHRINYFLYGLSLAVSFALGMHSLREMLILNIPLIILECVHWLSAFRKEKSVRTVWGGHKRRIVYVFAVFVANCAGLISIKFLNILSNPIISDISLELNPHNLLQNLASSTKDLLTISGLIFCTYGLAWMPLFLCSLVIVSAVIYTIICIIKYRDHSLLANIVAFSAISLLCVYGTGIFLFRTRALYYFVWYLLASSSIVYVFEKGHLREKMQVMMILVLCGIGGVNYFCNFVTDYFEYAEKNCQFEQIIQELLNQGVTCMYVDIHTNPRIPVYSKDKMISGTFKYDYEETDGYMLDAIDYLIPTDIFGERDNESSVICLSNWSFSHLEKKAPKQYITKLISLLEPVGQYSITNDTTYYVYKAPYQMIRPPKVSGNSGI